MIPNHPVAPFMLARAYSEVVREWLTEEELDEAMRLNVTERDPRFCHSADHCDQMIALLAAYNRLTDIDTADVVLAEVADLFEATLMVARASGFATGLPEHTPFPWFLEPAVSGNGDYALVALNSGKRVIIAEAYGAIRQHAEVSPQGGANAAMLLFCASVHADLVEALTAARDLLEQHRDDFPDPDEQDKVTAVLEVVSVALNKAPPPVVADDTDAVDEEE